jgi:cell wall-associated NlpC family hydrolase
MKLLDYIGIPYEAGGLPPVGADCYTLVRHYAATVRGQRWPEYMYDHSQRMLADATRLILAEMKELGGRWKPVVHEEYGHGDLLLFRIKGHPVHCGIYVQDGLFLHTMAGRMSCLEPLDNWRDALVGAYRWDGYDSGL